MVIYLTISVTEQQQRVYTETLILVFISQITT